MLTLLKEVSDQYLYLNQQSFYPYHLCSYFICISQGTLLPTRRICFIIHWFHLHFSFIQTQRHIYVYMHTLSMHTPPVEFPISAFHWKLYSSKCESQIPSYSPPSLTSFHLPPKRNQGALWFTVDPGKEFRIFLEENTFFPFFLFIVRIL